jgi:TolB-like protein
MSIQQYRATEWLRRLRAVVAPLALVVFVSSQAWAAEGSVGAPKLLLLPILVHSSEDPEYLQDGLSDMLQARFSRIGALNLVRLDKPTDGTTRLDKALALGRKAGADYVLYGSFTRFGQGASLDVQCSATDESKKREPLREIFVHSGSIGEIIPDLDELAGKVSRFAQGEAALTLVPPDDSGTGLAAAAASREIAPAGENLEDLVFRIDALEAALAELLEASDLNESME